MLWIGLHLPSLSLESFAATLADDDARRPVALIAEHRISAVNAAAVQRGIQPGMKRATALALAPDLVLGQADAQRDADALLALAQATLMFTPMVALEDFTPLVGGVPIVVDGQIVGAIGVSGAASAKQDEELALVGAAALADTPATATLTQPVQFFAGADVAAAFVKGAPLIETSDFKIHASHRDGPGMVEIHRDDTDLIYVVAGTATMVTGGSVSGGKLISDGETRGAAIKGGDVRRLAKGDVLVVPRGVPHWFKEVDGTFDYYVVKVN